MGNKCYSIPYTKSIGDIWSRIKIQLWDEVQCHVVFLGATQRLATCCCDNKTIGRLSKKKRLSIITPSFN